VRVRIAPHRGERTTATLVSAVLDRAPDGAADADVLVLLDGAELVDPLSDEGGDGSTSDTILIASADDPGTLAVARDWAGDGHVATVGYSSSASLRVDDVSVALSGTSFSAVAGELRYPVRLPLVGERHIPAALAALGAGLAAGVTADAAAAALAGVRAVDPGNLEIVASSATSLGAGVTLIDDGYDFTPLSTTEALKTLAEITRGTLRSVAVLGELDLGDVIDPQDVRDAHDRIGRLVVRLNVDRLIVVGQSARHIHNAAGLEGSWNGESVLVDTPDEAYALLNETEDLRGLESPGTVILVKSSASGGLRDLGDLIGRVTA
jgi:UDP-N-acetylmuramoyl-tripeptide--D-alanyl-D-alanine ligase